jgi:hypothetical protein
MLTMLQMKHRMHHALLARLLDQDGASEACMCILVGEFYRLTIARASSLSLTPLGTICRPDRRAGDYQANYLLPPKRFSELLVGAVE